MPSAQLLGLQDPVHGFVAKRFLDFGTAVAINDEDVVRV
jgi:hypothetical protein